MAERTLQEVREWAAHGAESGEAFRQAYHDTEAEAIVAAFEALP